MTNQEVTQQIKGTALNRIRKIYNPESNILFGRWDEEGSYAEQRDEMVCVIIEKMEKDLKEHKIKCKITK